MDALLQDVRYALRSLRRAPGFALVAVFTLALGVDANTAIFSLVDAVLLKPLPYREPARLIVAWDSYLPRDKFLPVFPKIGVSPAELELWRAQKDIFEETAWYRYVPYEFNLTAPGGEALSMRGGFLSTNFLRVIGVAPALGRSFEDHESPNSVLLSDHLWRTRLAADPKIAGKIIRLNDDGYLVIGVMPRNFKFPDWADLWLPPGPLNGGRNRDRWEPALLPYAHVPDDLRRRTPYDGAEGQTEWASGRRLHEDERELIAAMVNNKLFVLN